MKTTTKNKSGITKAVMLFLCLAFSGIASAQCNISFTYALGSSGLVNFTNTSTGLSGSPVYNWDFGYMNAYSNATSPSYTYLFNNSYTVTLSVNDSVNGCFSASTQTVTVSNTTALPPCSASFTYSVGGSGQVTFTNTSPTYSGTTNNYSWSFGDSQSDYTTSPVHSYFYNGSYAATLSLSNPYTSCNTSTTQTITISNANTVPPCSAAITYTTGANGLVNFSSGYAGAPTANYGWDFGNGAYAYTNNPTYSYPYNGTYTVNLTIMDSINGSCFTTATNTVTITNAPPCATPTVSFTLGPDSLGSPGVWNALPNYGPQISSAVWSWGDGTSSTGLSPTHTFASAGWYTICVKVYNPCNDSASYCQTDSVYHSASMVSVHVINTQATGISNVQTENASIKFYPNPNQGQFTLNMEGIDKNSTSVDVTVTSIVGQAVFQVKLPVSNGTLLKEINLTDISDGVYFVKLNSGNKIYTKRIVVKK